MLEPDWEIASSTTSVVEYVPPISFERRTLSQFNEVIGTGVLTAIMASLCCITPLLALIAGTSGVAASFAWIEPFRPYLIAITVLVLGFAWYQKIIPANDIDCQCETDEKPKFLQTKTFLSLVTLFSLLMMAFPSYSGFFYQKTGKNITLVDKSDIQKEEFKIIGMTCEGCEEHVYNEVNKLNRIVMSKVSYENKNAIIEFDRSKTNKTEIEKSINSTGYKVAE